MTSEDRGHYSKKHSGDKEINPDIVKAIKEKASDNRITCAASFKIADTCGVTADEIGFTLDMLEVRLIRCQMGIFGYLPEKKVVKPADTVSDDIKALIDEKLVDGYLTCASAWEVASALGRPKMDVSSACEKLGIKIKPCQLGAF